MSKISDEFVKIIKDFLKDILTTFPEYKNSNDSIITIQIKTIFLLLNIKNLLKLEWS